MDKETEKRVLLVVVISLTVPLCMCACVVVGSIARTTTTKIGLKGKL